MKQLLVLLVLTSAILSAISKRVNYQSFNTWFKPISSADKDDTNVYLKVPSEVFRDWIVNNYSDIIEESLEELDLDGYSIKFLIEDRTKSEEKINNLEKSTSWLSYSLSTGKISPALA